VGYGECNFAASKSREMPDASLIAATFVVVTPHFTAPPDLPPGAVR